MVNLDEEPSGSHPLGSSKAEDGGWIPWAMLTLGAVILFLPIYLAGHPADRLTFFHKDFRQDFFRKQVLLPRQAVSSQPRWSNGPETDWVVLFSKPDCAASTAAALAFRALANTTSQRLRFGVADCGELPDTCASEAVDAPPALKFYRAHEAAHASAIARLPLGHVDHPDHREHDPPAFARDAIASWEPTNATLQGQDRRALVVDMLSWLRQAHATPVDEGVVALPPLDLPSAAEVVEMMGPRQPHDEL